jgi:hypothetical protein
MLFAYNVLVYLALASVIFLHTTLAQIIMLVCIYYIFI